MTPSEEQYLESNSSSSSEDEEAKEGLNETFDEIKINVNDPFEISEGERCEEFKPTEQFALWTNHIKNLANTIELEKFKETQDYETFHLSLSDEKLSALTSSMTEQLSLPINWWADMPKIVALKTVLTLFTLEIELA